MHLPVRLRITLAFGLAMAVVLIGFAAFLYERVGSELLARVDVELRGRADVLQSAVAGHQPVPIAPSQSLIDPDEAFAQVLDANGNILDSSSAVAGAPMLPVGQVRAVERPTFVQRRVDGVDDPARLLAVPLATADGRQVIVVGATLGDHHEALQRLLVQLLVGGPVALLLACGLGWVVAGAALRPVERLRREAAAITSSDQQHRVAVPPTGDELARLALTLNDMLARLEASMARERRFVDDASHELRTPLAVLKGELDLALSVPRSATELEAALRVACTETDRLVRLAEDLLVLARVRGGRMPLRREPVAVRKLLEDVAAGLPVQVEATTEVVRLDPVRVRQAVGNVVDNALRHGAGPIVVRGCLVGQVLRIEVDDRGPGFPEDLLVRAFEPFVCSGGPDGGTGLGLAIVQAAVEAHGGTCAAQALLGGGARVTLLLPAAPLG